MLSLAVFYFVFLGTEYLFDNRMALYTDPTGVVLAQSYILGVSALGFLAYSLIEKWKSKSGNPTAFKAAGFFLPVIAGYVLLFVGTGYWVLLGSGCFLFLILGYLGSRTHYLAAQLLRGSRHPAKTVSVAYAVGLLLQFLNHNLLWGETVGGIFLAVGSVGTDCRNGAECTARISQETEGRGRRNGVGEKRAGRCYCGADIMEESPAGRCGITGDGCSDDLYLRNA